MGDELNDPVRHENTEGMFDGVEVPEFMKNHRSAKACTNCGAFTLKDDFCSTCGEANGITLKELGAAIAKTHQLQPFTVTPEARRRRSETKFCESLTIEILEAGLEAYVAKRVKNQ